ncbi:UNKNOWN [Stylonychia lemnae]|uniref:ADP-ribosylglycohydrolase n=1 Tax=Stylonychia lemnae TaxID=5949 RepID=A0A078BEI9_STYLE|nr:UNKNOWN [Stylonychia lemnae]|eukprot:CDW91567.1 UNKNOWN [Stylonychia lemnae]
MELIQDSYSDKDGSSSYESFIIESETQEILPIEEKLESKKDEGVYSFLDMNKNTRFTSQSLGSILGAFIGDAAGAHVEFFSKVNDSQLEDAMNLVGGGPHRIASGQITDDSELALCIFHALLKSQGLLNLDEIAKMNIKWISTRPFDIGFTTKTAFTPLIFNAKGIFEQVKSNNQSSQSNGCIMRVTPFAVWASQLSNQDLYKAVYLQTYMTHCHQLAIDSTYLYCLAIKLILNGLKDRKIIFDTVKEEAFFRNQFILCEWLEEAQQFNLPQTTINDGWLKIAFIYSFHYLISGSDYKQSLRSIIQKGGDTDTNAAIVGGLIGAFNQIQDIDPTMVRKVMNLRFNSEMIYQSDYDERKFGIKRPDFLVPGLSLTSTNLYEFFRFIPKELKVIFQGKLYEGNQVDDLIKQYPLFNQSND